MRKLSSPTPLLAALTAAALLSPAGEAVGQEPNFGRAIVMEEADLAIGQPVNWYGPGVVYTYRLDDAGRWTEHSRLSASDADRKDDFGRTIAVSGNTMVVGAPRKRDGSGVAYAFVRDAPGGTWRQAAILEPPAQGDHSEYAASLAFAGDDDLLIGSPAVDSVGVIYHLRRNGGAWTMAGTIRSEDSGAGGGFGGAMSVDGDWLLVGAAAADSARGQIFFFRRGDDGSWSQAQVVNPPDAVADKGSNVGATLLLDGERAFVGAPGAAKVFVLALNDEGNWAPAGELTPFDGGERTRYGQSVAVAGDEVWVGAPGTNRFNGTVYRYLPDGDGGWRGALRVAADSADGTAWPFAYGLTMAAEDDHVVVGMPFRDFGEGRVVAMSRDGDGWSAGQMLEGEVYRIGQDLASGDRCQDGRIDEFPCASIEVVAHMPIEALGGARGVWVNDVWGWSDGETGRDYALVARRDGASFVDVTDPAAPRLVGTLPRTEGSPPTVWRDIKVANDHAYVVADGAGEHGMQVFDLTRLRGVTGDPVTFTPDATYHEIASAHNVVADTATGYLYVVGASGGGQSCGGGLHMVDARNPQEPTFAGCYNDTSGSNPRGYTHDAQCIVYAGPDEEYRGRQICIGSNEKEINIADVTDKENPVTIGRATYPDAAYTHQGWFDDEQRYFYQNDEIDELQGTVEGTRTIVWDLTELEDPILANQYIGPVLSSDHNLFVKGDRVYESNYGSGLRVLDISDRANPKEIAYFDSAPYNDDGPGHSSGQSGAWSNYPFFDSGVVVFTSVREGLFIVRVAEDKPVS